MKNDINVIILFLCYISMASEPHNTSSSRSPKISPRTLRMPCKNENHHIDVSHPLLIRVKKQSKDELFENPVQMHNFLDLLNKKKKSVNND